ncbi:hypothetical protein CVT25_015020 [Psilocybe cyanescens]|uniref:Cytochrome P450 n=1 Tax=Psilocybe cyanescens TaxID=93625 RepID=A0A409X8Y5_PSICY|nr:hypothetical protein CVT25_015020 [Psilocybe cyanescens]
MYPTLTSLVVLGAAWLIYKLLSIGRRDKSLPPGPPTLPILGNIHLIPPKFTFLKFSEWAQEYGGIISVKVANQTIIVLSDMKSVKELLDDRISETSSRPFLYALDVVTGGNVFSFAPADNHVWKTSRKAIQPLVTPQAVQTHLPISETETTQLLYDILHGPEVDFRSHVSRFAFSFITSVLFGKPAPRYNSPESTQYREYTHQLLKTVSPEAAPVDLIPILKYIPERWAPFKQLWRETRRLQRALYFSFLEHTEQKVTSGNKTGSMIEDVLRRQSELGISRELTGYLGGILIDGGTDTSSALLQSLVLRLMKSPASLRKAQNEVDTVVGKKRLPVSSDVSALPYVQALIKEIHRMTPAGPVGVPHAAFTDCQYREYTIPKGAPIIINIWGIMHDPDLFERPDEFWPERYLLTPDGTRPGIEKDYNIRSTLPFGSGKRLCPGMHLANMNLNLAVMRLIWAFDFAPIGGPIPQPEKWNVADEYTYVRANLIT